MKRLFSLLLVVIALAFASCAKPQEHDKMITGAIAELKDHWQAFYATSSIATDRHFEIKNTRVLTIKENDTDSFADIAYIIDFDIYTDYFGTAFYYENAGINDNVLIYKDGSMEVTSDRIRAYRAATFQVDYSGFLDSVDDYGGQYNCVEKLK